MTFWTDSCVGATRAFPADFPPLAVRSGLALLPAIHFDALLTWASRVSE